MPDWMDGLSHKDWLFDGRPIKGEIMLARFNNLDWSKAWLDLGPSIAGNLGPYWHVPLRETWINGELYDFGDTTHRLYPKVLKGKWLVLIRHAIKQYAEQDLTRIGRKPIEFCDKCLREVAEISSIKKLDDTIREEAV